MRVPRRKDGGTRRAEPLISTLMASAPPIGNTSGTTRLLLTTFREFDSLVVSSIV